MDVMKIEGKIMTAIVARIIRKGIKKGLGIDTKVNLNRLYFQTDKDGLAHVHLDIDLDGKAEDLKAIIGGDD